MTARQANDTRRLVGAVLSLVCGSFTVAGIMMLAGALG